MDLLDRLYFRLRQTAGEPQPAGADGNSFTIAELYQRLIPYRAVRGDLGIMELAQYEHALLRLLSGERGYVRVELPEVRDEIRRELSTPNPILGIYRDYAAVSVRLVADPAAEAERTEPLPPRPRLRPPLPHRPRRRMRSRRLPRPT